MNMKIKIAAQSCSLKSMFSIIFIALSFGSFAQEASESEFKGQNYFGATVGIHRYPGVFNTTASTTYSENRAVVEFGFSYQEQVNKNWYREFGLPYFRYSKDSNVTRERSLIPGTNPSSFATLDGEVLNNLELAVRYEHGFNGWHITKKKFYVAFGAALQFSYSNFKITPSTRNTIAFRQNIAKVSLQGSPKVVYKMNDKLKVEFKLIPEFISIAYKEEDMEDLSSPNPSTTVSEFSREILLDDTTFGLAIKMALK